MSGDKTMSAVFGHSRVSRWVARTWKTGALATELMRIVNKTPLIKVSRWLVDVLHFLPRRRRTPGPVAISAEGGRRMLDQLRRQGWTHVPDDISPEVRRHIRDECLVLHQKYHDMKTRDPGRYKDIWNYISDIGFGRERPGPDNVFVQYAISKPILDVVAGYLGETPWLRYIILTESVYQEGDLKFSQKWHLDFDDARMVKLFVYLTDVSTAADGPFQLISAEFSDGVRNGFVRRHIDDAQLFPQVGPAALVNMMGQGLTSFLADTGRVYHCGSRLGPGHSRLLYTALYTAYPSIYPGAREMFSVTPETPEYIRQVLTPKSVRTQR
jgi:hypothetical protein